MYSPKYLHDSLHAAKTDMARTLLYELNSVLVCENKATVEWIILVPILIVWLTVRMHIGAQKLNCIQPANVLTGINMSACCVLMSANSVVMTTMDRPACQDTLELQSKAAALPFLNFCQWHWLSTLRRYQQGQSDTRLPCQVGQIQL